MKAKLISWVFARDLNQWIPAGDEVIDVSVFDPLNPSHSGKVLIDFEVLKLSVPNFKDFLELDGLRLEWLDLGLEYIGG